MKKLVFYYPENSIYQALFLYLQGVSSNVCDLVSPIGLSESDLCKELFSSKALLAFAPIPLIPHLDDYRILDFGAWIYERGGAYMIQHELDEEPSVHTTKIGFRTRWSSAYLVMQNLEYTFSPVFEHETILLEHMRTHRLARAVFDSISKKALEKIENVTVLDLADAWQKSTAFELPFAVGIAAKSAFIPEATLSTLRKCIERAMAALQEDPERFIETIMERNPRLAQDQIEHYMTGMLWEPMITLRPRDRMCVDNFLSHSFRRGLIPPWSETIRQSV